MTWSPFYWLHVCTCLLICIATVPVYGQSDKPYHLNGDAYQENCNCYTLTPDEFWMSGSVWNINKINLEESFDFKFTIFLGCHDNDGADGIAFVLQPVSTSIGSEGGGLGYDGVSPSIGVLVDTWQNFEDNDPPEDHIAIHKNGLIDHSTMTDVTSPVPASPYTSNIEDCNWHILRIIWDPALKLLKVEFDGVYRTGVTYDLINEVFGGDPMVYWGFTAATGGAKNHQRVCTSLDPKFIFPEGQNTCFPATVQLIDSSVSFGTIEKWFWDFGDGTIWEGSSTPPPHDYSAPGEYTASLKILGNDGCLSAAYIDTIVMGTEPVAKIGYAPYPVCEGVPTSFFDSSVVEFGTIDKWKWNIGDQEFSDQMPPPLTIVGRIDVTLQVGTKEGCESAPTSATLASSPIPQVDFSSRDVCASEPTVFQGVNTKPAVGVSRWVWDFGDGVARNSLSPGVSYRYRSGGTYDVQLTGYSNIGCASATVSKTVNVYETHAYAGNDTIIAENQPLQLQASGGQYYNWSPSTGLSDDKIPNPIATLARSTSFVLTAFTEAGCATTDTLNLKVFKGPSFYVPSAFSPNGDGKNDDFRFIAVGMSKIASFQVYNRYGQLVYSSTQVMKGWDGTLGGVEQPAGTYVWVISGVDLSGQSHFKKGTVLLIR
jgi:gliding motility-associated-like protein